MTPRLAVPVHTVTSYYALRDPKFGRIQVHKATLEEARATKQTLRRLRIEPVTGRMHQAGPCSRCGWTSPLQTVKAAAEEQARWHRQQHRLEDASSSHTPGPAAGSPGGRHG